jgi:glycosyltransferase involved in cell wall biosynthesis
MKLLRRKAILMAFTFNHGNKNFFSGIFLIMAQWALAKVAVFVTHSSMERKLYSKKYYIDERRIIFTHWAVGAPDVSGQNFAVGLEEYVCCIGRNNRDFETFIKAAKESEISAVLICGQGQINKDILPNNVLVGFDIEKQECDNLIAGSLATVIPLIDDSTGAGHMTIVTSMLLGVPVIATKVQSVEDYVFDELNGILVTKSSVSEMAAAFRRLKDDADFRARLSAGTISFAEKYLTEARAAEFLGEVLKTYG